MDDPATVERLQRLADVLDAITFHFARERVLQDGIAEELRRGGFTFEREVISGTNRFDFLVDGGIVIETKTRGSLSDAALQVARYLELDGVRGALLASTMGWARGAGGVLAHNGKPWRITHLRRTSF